MSHNTSQIAKTIKLKRGFDVPLRGAAPAAIEAHALPDRVAVYPDDFPGFIAKPDVHEGDPVYAGQPLMHCKEHPQVCLASPCAGVVEAVVRGERRKVLRVVVRRGEGCDAPQRDAAFNPLTAPLDEVAGALGRSGLWAWMRQRPYDIVPDPATRPRDIFVTAFDSAPLAPTLVDAAGSREELEAGVRLLDRFTEGSVVISAREGSGLEGLEGAELVDIRGPHPAGNVGVQINNIFPLAKGEMVWTLDVVTLGKIGRWALTGTADFSTVVAVTGPAALHPRRVDSLCGADLSCLLRDELPDDGRTLRIISGNPLTGVAESSDGFLRFPYRQVTVIRSGDDRTEFMGWASLSPDKLSRSRTFLSGFLPKRRLGADALLHGSQRAMILSGVYDKLLPMDVMPEPLIKAILSGDPERMDSLGIREVAPEDFALAEWADPSKLPLQQIVRRGIDDFRKEA